KKEYNNEYNHITIIYKYSSTMYLFYQVKYNDTVVIFDKHLLLPYDYSADYDLLFLFPVIFAPFSKINNQLLQHHISHGDVEIIRHQDVYIMCLSDGFLVLEIKIWQVPMYQ